MSNKRVSFSNAGVGDSAAAGAKPFLRPTVETLGGEKEGGTVIDEGVG